LIDWTVHQLLAERLGRSMKMNRLKLYIHRVSKKRHWCSTLWLRRRL